MKTIYYVAASLDGFIADGDGGVDWLEKVQIDHENNGCAAFFETIDGVLMGRNTFDFIDRHGQWPYENKPAWVCSSRSVPQMKGCRLQKERSIDSAIEAARLLNIGRLWVVGGGQVVTSMIQQRLLTHISISIMPILLGKGLPSVHWLPNHCFLRQIDSHATSGFTQIEYEIVDVE